MVNFLFLSYNFHMKLVSVDTSVHTAIVKEAKLDVVIWTLLQASWRMMCSIIKLNLHIQNLSLMLPQ